MEEMGNVGSAAPPGFRPWREADLRAYSQARRTGEDVRDFLECRPTDPEQRAVLTDVARGESRVFKAADAATAAETAAIACADAMGRGRRVKVVVGDAARAGFSRVMAEMGLADFVLPAFQGMEGSAAAAAKRAARQPQAYAAPGRRTARREELKSGFAAMRAALAAPYGKTGKTAGAILWEARTAGGGTPPKAQIPDYDDLGPELLAEAEEAMRAHARAHAEAFAAGVSPDEHPWHGFGRIDAEDAELAGFSDVVRRWAAACARLSGVQARLAEMLSDVPSSTQEDLVALRAMIDDARDLVAEAPVGLLRSLQIPAARHAAREAAAILASAREVKDKLSGRAGAGADPNALRGAAKRAADAGLGERTPAELEELETRLRAVEGYCRARGDDVRAACERIGMSKSVVLSDLALLAAAAKILRSVPPEAMGLRSASLADPAARKAISQAEEEVARLASDRELFRRLFDLDSAAAAGPATLEARANALDQGEFGLLSPSWWTASKLHAHLSRDPAKKTAAVRAQELRQLATHLREAAKFESDRTLRRLCGPLFVGMDTPFDRMREAGEAVERVRAAMKGAGETGEILRKAFESGSTENLSGLAECVPPDAEACLSIPLPTSLRGTALSDAAVPLGRILDAMRAIRRSCSEADGLDKTQRLRDLPGLADALDDLRIKEDALERLHLAAMLGEEHYHGLDTRAELLAAALDAAEGFDALPEGLAAHCLSSDGGISGLYDLLKEASEAANAEEEAFVLMRGEGLLSSDEFLHPTTGRTTRFDELAKRAEECEKALDLLPGYVRWRRAWRTLERHGWDENARAHLDRGVAPDDLFAAFRTSLRAAQAADATTTIPLEMRVNGEILDGRLLEMRRLDAEIRSLLLLQIAARIDETRPSDRASAAFSAFAADGTGNPDDGDLAEGMAAAMPCALFSCGQAEPWAALDSASWDLVVFLDAEDASAEDPAKTGQILCVVPPGGGRGDGPAEALERAGVGVVLGTYDRTGEGNAASRPPTRERTEGGPLDAAILARLSAAAGEFGAAISGPYGKGGLAAVAGAPHPDGTGRIALFLDGDCDGVDAETGDVFRPWLLERRKAKLHRLWAVAWELEPLGEAKRLREAVLKAIEDAAAPIEEKRPEMDAEEEGSEEWRGANRRKGRR